MDAHAIALTLTVCCAASVGLTLLAEFNAQRPEPTWRALKLVGKPCASLAFIALALHLANWDVEPDGYAHLIVIGLVFGAGGDVALMSKAKNWFLVGLVSFLFGHIAYLVAFARLTTVSEWVSPWSLLPIGAAVVVLKYLWRHLGSMRVPVLAYMVAIVLMAIAALALARKSAPALGEQAVQFAVVGALLFFASDVAVAKARFVKARFVDRLWGLPCYYAGQLCIAWSLAS
tara:strand:+ start:126202 stop:126894 length:693 start_codon:yes stop_codon:yes gene_type:complete